MTIKYENRYACNPEDFKAYDTSRIRKDFLIENVMVENEINLCYMHCDRYISRWSRTDFKVPEIRNYRSFEGRLLSGKKRNGNY